MKSSPLSRKTPMKRGSSRLKRSGIKKVNPERQAKRRKSYAKKLAAYKRSETYQIVEARSGGQCEQMVVQPFLAGMPERWHRCMQNREAGDRLTHHHKTYARFGGKERPEDISVLCDRHNAEAESKHPTRNRDYRKAS